MMTFTLWDILRNLLLAARWTVVLSLVSFIGGGLLGMALLYLRIGKARAGQIFVQGYVELFQGTPLLMQLFLAFFGLGLFGIDVPAWLAAGLASWWRSGAAVWNRSPAASGRRRPASAWATSSRCAT
ncbi:ABC transporter permease subunit [Azospirillum brasilense]|uniref:ABC transporter permease subunit n=1 Tax=Azospirillum brasilense TaxID=192 RepID=UPI00039B1362